MNRKARLLLIGASAYRDALASALPNCDVLVAEQPLEGLWQSGQGRFERAFVSLGVGSTALRAVSSLRQVSPSMRIVVGCEPADEPIARRALAEGADSQAYDINTSGQVLGRAYNASGKSRALLWENGAMYELDDLIPYSSGWDLKYAYGINDVGQIVGAGQHSGQYRAFLLTPIPEPSAICDYVET